MVDRTEQQLGNYRLLHLIGQGGFADVYLGEHVHLGTHAAVKVLHTQLTGDDVTGFRNEARTIAQLEHPHIVRVLDFGLDGTTPYLVMSYAPNSSLRQLHPRGTPLPLKTIVSYIQQVANALQYAHDEKFIHRDIKPENMLLDRHNIVLLSDFGIALVAQSTKMQSVQEVIGTVAYMAPEMLQGHPKPASDQYALGIVVYEWLSGERPFHGAFTELASQHMFVSPPPLIEKVPALSPEIERVVLTALSKEPSQRFGSVKAFAHALEQACMTAKREVPQPSAPSMNGERITLTSSSQKEAAFSSFSPLPPIQLATPSQPSLPPTQYVVPANAPLLPTQSSMPDHLPLKATQFAVQPSFAPTEYAQPRALDTEKPESKAKEISPRRRFKNTFLASKPTLADYLFLAKTKKSRLRRDALLVLGCSIALFLWSHVYFASQGLNFNRYSFSNNYSYSFSLELLLTLPVIASLGKWRSAIVMVVGGIMRILLPSVFSVPLLGFIGNFLVVGGSYGGLHVNQVESVIQWNIEKGIIYVIVALIVGWLCEQGLGRRFRTSIPIMLPVAVIVSITVFQFLSCFDTNCGVEPVSFAFAYNYPEVFPFPVVIGHCIQALVVGLILPLLWKLPRVKLHLKEQTNTGV